MRTTIRLCCLIVCALACTYALAITLSSILFTITAVLLGDAHESALQVLSVGIYVILATPVLFSFPGLNALRKRWGLLSSSGARAVDHALETRHQEQADRRRSEAEASLIITETRTVVLIVLYLACGVLFGSACIVFALGVLSAINGVVISSLGSGPVWAGASVMIATWFAFAGLNALRTRWSFGFRLPTYTRRHATTDFV